MDSHLRPEDTAVRLADSPRRSPQITQALTSPARSVHPEMMAGMESLHSQADFGMRTTDFFDDTSEEESANIIDPAGEGPSVDLLGRGGTSSKRSSRQRPPTSEPFVAAQCESKRSPFQVEPDGYHRLAANATHADAIRYADTPSSSFNGSVDELLPSEDRMSPPRNSTTAHMASGRAQRGSAQVEFAEEQQSPKNTAKIDQILGAHAIAHEITLAALMRDEEALDRSLQSFAPLHSEHRGSLLPASLRPYDPRSPRNQTFSTPQSTHSKKVHVVPPPIDTSGPRHYLPADLVRTPYPYTPQKVHRKDFGQNPPTIPEAPRTPGLTDSTLTLSIRRASGGTIRKVTSLVIPASNEYTAIGEKERHFKAIDFDDAELFRQLRTRYSELSGMMRFFSARSLSRIAVSGPASKAADAGYGWLHQPRSPRVLAYRGLSDTFSEEKILQHYRKPMLGRSRYAFVQWAHRLAAAPPVNTPQGEEGIEAAVERDLVRRMEQPEGLEFVLSWSIARIATALALVFVATIAAVLLWVFLERNTTAGRPPDGGYRDAGDRVTTGVLMGICILLAGLSGIAGWLGISWLVV